MSEKFNKVDFKKLCLLSKVIKKIDLKKLKIVSKVLKKSSNAFKWRQIIILHTKSCRVTNF